MIETKTRPSSEQQLQPTVRKYLHSKTYKSTKSTLSASIAQILYLKLISTLTTGHVMSSAAIFPLASSEAAQVSVFSLTGLVSGAHLSELHGSGLSAPSVRNLIATAVL